MISISGYTVYDIKDVLPTTRIIIHNYLIVNNLEYYIFETFGSFLDNFMRNITTII